MKGTLGKSLTGADHVVTSPVRLTQKQYALLTVICDGNGNDESGKFVPVDVDELLERLSYRTDKPSLQFSIRALVKRQLIEKVYEVRRGRKRVCYMPTEVAKWMMGYDHDRSYIAGYIEELYDL